LFIDEKEVSVSIGNKKLIIGRIKSKGKKKINAYDWMINNNIKPSSKLGE
jgi:methionyl-tRNA formyltransferase